MGLPCPPPGAVNDGCFLTKRAKVDAEAGQRRRSKQL